MSDPAGAWWEVYTVLGDSDVFDPTEAASTA